MQDLFWKHRLYATFYEHRKAVGIEHHSIATIQWDVLPGRHLHSFAPEAREENPGKGVGLCVSIPVDGTLNESRLQRISSGEDSKEECLVKLANNLYDLLRD